MKNTWLLSLSILIFVSQKTLLAENTPSRHYADSLLSKVRLTKSPIGRAKLYTEMIEAFMFLDKDSSQIFFNMASNEIRAIKSKKLSDNELREVGVLEGKLLFEIGTMKYVESLFDSALMYYKKAAVLQEKWKDKANWSKTLNYIARIYERQGKDIIFYELTQKALHIQEEIEDTNGVAVSQIAIADFYRRKGTADSSEYYYVKALKLLRKTNNPLRLSFCLLTQGSFFEEQGRYGEAIALFFEAVKIQEANKLYIGAMKSQIKIASVYIKLNVFDKALTFLSEAERLNKYVEGPIWQEAIYNKYGLLYSEQNNHKKSLEYYQKSLEIAVDFELGEMIKVESMRAIGVEYRELGQIKKSINVLEEAYILSRPVSAPAGKTAVILELGKSYLADNNYGKAKQYLTEAYNLAQETRVLSSILKSSEGLHIIAQKQNDYESALKYYKVFISVRDSMKMDEAEKQLIRKEVEHRLNIKNTELLQEQQKLKLMEKDKKLKNYMIIILSLVTILLVIVFIYVYRYLNVRGLVAQKRIEQYAEQITNLQKNVERLLKQEAINPSALIIDKSINKYLETELSVRELDVLKQLSTGKSNQEISDELSVSVNTIRSHLQKIYDKLEVKNRTQAIKKVSDIYLINTETKLT